MDDREKSKIEKAIDTLREALTSRDPDRIIMGQKGVKEVVAYFTKYSGNVRVVHDLARELPAMEAHMNGIAQLCYKSKAEEVEDAIRSMRLVLADRVMKEPSMPEKLDPLIGSFTKSIEDLLNKSLPTVRDVKGLREDFYGAARQHAKNLFRGGLLMTPEEAAGHVVLVCKALKQTAGFRMNEGEKELVEAAIVELKLAFASWAAPILAAETAKAVDVGSIQPHYDPNERRY